MPFCRISLQAKKPQPLTYPSELHTWGDHVRKRRLDLDIFQKTVAQQIGVDTATVTNWEKNRTSPHLHQFPKVIEFLGYTPDIAQTETSTLGEKIVATRRHLGLSQKKLARRLGVDPGTLSRWEKDESEPNKELSERLTTFLNELEESSRT